MLQLANQYSTDFLLWTTCAGGSAQNISLSFVASHLRVLNYAGVPLHVNIASTANASTDDPEIYATERLILDAIPFSSVSVMTTSTTTSTVAAGGAVQRVVVSAWGG
ncbi:MAG TPA: hypothetical protein DCP69_04870 [Candidatus Omnitrophica bacterium]|nr:hypothetical protein [Candidatus Omnitrophota bacterium]